MIAAILGIVLLGAVTIGPILSNVETPNYLVLSSEDYIEVRRYDPMIIAQVEVNDDREAAINQGFRLLADHIFGNNLAQQDIAMTAPVQQQAGAKIAMTAPVQQQSVDDRWLISFVMPAEYNMDTLPQPVNDRIKLKKVPTQKFAVIKFSGTSSDENLKIHLDKLMDYIQSNQLSITGSPKYAFYNPPITLPPMRRNEIMIQIQN